VLQLASSDDSAGYRPHLIRQLHLFLFVCTAGKHKSGCREATRVERILLLIAQLGRHAVMLSVGTWVLSG